MSGIGCIADLHHEMPNVHLGLISLKNPVFSEKRLAMAMTVSDAKPGRSASYGE
jgi:hypothetical protein